jgi:hypothetical protein
MKKRELREDGLDAKYLRYDVRREAAISCPNQDSFLIFRFLDQMRAEIILHYVASKLAINSPYQSGFLKLIFRKYQSSAKPQLNTHENHQNSPHCNHGWIIGVERLLGDSTQPHAHKSSGR